MEEIVKNLGDIGTFGIFALALVVSFFRWALPPILEKFGNRKQEEKQPKPTWPDGVAEQLKTFDKRLEKIETAIEGTNLGLVLHRISELAKQVEAGFTSARGAREKIHVEVDEIKVACSATHSSSVKARAHGGQL